MRTEAHESRIQEATIGKWKGNKTGEIQEQKNKEEED